MCYCEKKDKYSSKKDESDEREKGCSSDQTAWACVAKYVHETMRVMNKMNEKDDGLQWELVHYQLVFAHRINYDWNSIEPFEFGDYIVVYGTDCQKESSLTTADDIMSVTRNVDVDEAVEDVGQNKYSMSAR